MGRVSKLKDLLTGALIGIAITVSITAMAVITLAEPILSQVLQRVQVRTLDSPRIWFRWDVDIFPTRQCWYIKTEEIPNAPKHDWLPMIDVININAQIFGVTSLTSVERDMCFSNMPPLPPPPVYVFKVTPAGTATTRTLYDGAAYEANNKVWIPIGVVAKDTACEPAVIRKTTLEYHYVTNAAGVRGLAACK